jgi:predicted phage tail component-like protein
MKGGTNLKSLTFNGIRKPWLYLLEGRQKAPFAPITRNLLRIPGRPGALLQSSETEPLTIYQPIGFVVRDDIHELQIKNELASWLVTEKEVELQFDDEPGRTYYAVVQNTIEDLYRFANLRRGVIQFLVLDGYGYGPEQVVPFTSDIMTLTNNGTAEADPIFELEVKQPVTFAMIQNQDNEYMMIGKPVDEEVQQPTQEEEVLINNPMESTVGWTSPAKLENAALQGEMRTSGGSFYGHSFGEPVSSWYYGPALKTSLGEEIGDFGVEAIVTFDNSSNPNMAGKVEISLLDVADNVVAVMALKDSYSQQKMTDGIIRIGGISSANRYLLNTPGAVPGQWNGFRGMLRIIKKGNVWRGYIAKVTNQGIHHARWPVKWVDTENIFTDKKLAQIQVSTLRWGLTDIPDMWIHHLKVWKINDLSQSQIPYIADVGDVITFDHVNKNILINGEPRKDLKDFGSSYFKFKRGSNQLIVMPSESFDVTCRYRERYR